MHKVGGLTSLRLPSGPLSEIVSHSPFSGETERDSWSVMQHMHGRRACTPVQKDLILRSALARRFRRG